MENTCFNEIETKYSELAELHNSSRSNVYLVQNQEDGRIYIKKELLSYNIDVYKQLINIRNMFIASIYEVYECGNSLVIIEEFINGQTMQSIIDKEGPLDEVIAIKYVKNLCSILEILHNQTPAIIHRDIKPSNILIDNNGILKLIDFDVSRVYNGQRNMDTHILGTKGYASPEQFGFEETDCRSDIYSIGVLLNVLTTGMLTKEKLNQGKLKKIIEKCTNISPDYRYKNVMELKAELEGILGEFTLKKNKVYEEQEEVFKEEVKQEKSSKLTKIFTDLPGFREKKVWKTVVAALVYAFLVFGFTNNMLSGDIDLIYEDILTASLLFIIIFFNWDYKGIKNKLPMMKSYRIVGIVIYNILIFCTYGILI